MHLACIERETNKYFAFILNLSLVLRFSRPSNKRGEIFKDIGLSKIYVQNIVSNSHIFVFYSEEVPMLQSGNATNWNSIGYFDFQGFLGKKMVKYLTNSVTVSPGQCND